MTRIWLRMWLVASAVVVLAFVAISQLDRSHADDRTQLLAETFADRASLLMAKDLELARGSLRVLARDAALMRFASGHDELRAEIEARWQTLAEEDSGVLQVRLLGATGKERIRVDRRDDEVFVADVAQLQDKAGRSYFVSGARLATGRVLLTTLELNREHGQVETPWRPTFRAVSSLRSSEGLLLGVVVLNFDAAKLLQHVAAAPAELRAALYNRDGYLLAGGEPADRFSFEFGKPASVDATLWAWATKTPSGHEAFGDTLQTVRTIDAPAAVADPARSHTLKLMVAGDQARWITRGPSLWGVLLLVGLLGIASRLWARQVVAHRAADDARQAAMAQLFRSEKMASLGGMVAGVAHELNTPIGNALSVASSVGDYVAQFDQGFSAGGMKKSEVRRFLDEMREGSDIQRRNLARAADLVQRFKRVAVDQSSEQRRTFRLRDCVEDIARSLEPRFKTSPVALSLDLDDALLDGYPGPLGGVLMNLIENARIHGFPADAAGTVTVTTKRLDGDRVEIRIDDDGVGVPEEWLDRVFEPFFTSQLGTGGSGLGLSIAHNTITMLGGTLTASRRLGQGTTFSAVIPSCAPASTHQQNPHSIRTFDELSIAA